MKICKFGGTSLATAGGVAKVCNVVLGDHERRVVVVSAPGKRTPDDRKVTDMLIACAEARLAGKPGRAEIEAVIERFAGIQRGLNLPDSLTDGIRKDLAARMEGDIGHKGRFLDRMKAAGEDNCARLVTAELCRRGADARYLSPREGGLLLSDEYGNAQILPESYSNLAALREAEWITVFPGFFGYTRDGAVVTFPRGGSDITGAILAAAVGAEVYENFTDVDSVCAIDPDLAPDVKPIPELSYREMRELSYAGFNVLHEEAIVPTVRAGIPICVKNTASPEGLGTMIVPERKHATGDVVGIAYNIGFCTISMSKYLMNREIGFGRRLLQIIEDEGLSFEHMPSGIDTLSVVLREADLDEATEKRVLERIRAELGCSDAEIKRGLALVMIAGERMRHRIGTAATATRALADANVNIEMLDQGASEISMMFGVKQEDAPRAVRALYDAFFGRL
ncbi:MAG: aspartate kinase [Verrucomicrobiota bacterium]|nr:aspartate kinase [Verrucomicrobiota bacterium]